MGNGQFSAGELCQIADHLRLLSTLMGGLATIQKQQQRSLSQVLLDLAIRLEQFYESLEDDLERGDVS